MKEFFRKISNFFRVSEEARMPHDGIEDDSGIPAPIETGEGEGEGEDLLAFLSDDAGDQPVADTEEIAHGLTGVEDVSEVDGGGMKSALESARDKLDKITLTPQQQAEMDQLDISDNPYGKAGDHAAQVLALIIVKQLKLQVDTEHGKVLISTNGEAMLNYRTDMIEKMHKVDKKGFDQMLKKVYILTKDIDLNSTVATEPGQMASNMDSVTIVGEIVSQWEVQVPTEIQEIATDLSEPYKGYQTALADHKAGRATGIKVAMK